MIRASVPCRFAMTSFSLNVEQQFGRISCTSCDAKLTIEKGDFAKGWCFEHEICAMKTESSFGVSRKPEPTRVDCRRCKKKFPTQGVNKWQEYWYKLMAQADSWCDFDGAIIWQGCGPGCRTGGTIPSWYGGFYKEQVAGLGVESRPGRVVVMQNRLQD